MTRPARITDPFRGREGGKGGKRKKGKEKANGVPILGQYQQRIQMRLSFNFVNVNVYQKLHVSIKRLHATWRPITEQMVLGYNNSDNSITVSNGQQSIVTSRHQPSIKFIHLNIAEFCTKLPKYHVVL